MTPSAPHFLLFSETSSSPSHSGGRWRFVLQSLDGKSHFEADDEESEVCADRLELLALIRGLESLDQPSQVTVVTRRQAISSGLRFGLDTWRENDWQWERYGQMTAVKNQDLWKRIDQARQIHQVACRSWKYQAADDLNQPEANTDSSENAQKQFRVDRPHTASRPQFQGQKVAELWGKWIAAMTIWRLRLHAAFQVLMGQANVAENLS